MSGVRQRPVSASAVIVDRDGAVQIAISATSRTGRPHAVLARRGGYEVVTAEHVVTSESLAVPAFLSDTVDELRRTCARVGESHVMELERLVSLVPCVYCGRRLGEESVTDVDGNLVHMECALRESIALDERTG